MTSYLKQISVASAVVAIALAVFGVVWGARLPVEGWIAVNPGPATSRAVRIDLVDQALGEKNPSRAISEWREAYGEAFRSGQWEALVAVGDAALRVDAAAGPRAGFHAEARRAYLAALMRARAQRSAAGAARIAEAFARLGDREMAELAMRIAADLS
jgi:hypothetical protein